MKTFRVVVASLLALVNLIPGVAHAVGLGNPNTYTFVGWSVSTTVPQLATCTDLRVDATGDLNNSTLLTVYGVQTCTGGAYLVTGTAFVSANGVFNMNLFVGTSTVLQCSMLGLSGGCQYLTTGTGAVLGTAVLTFK